MSFELKKWLDQNVVPLLQSELQIHSFISKPGPDGIKPEKVLVWLVAKDDSSWPAIVKRLLSFPGIYFDFLRDAEVVELNGAKVAIFGGDGTPFIGSNCMAMTRLFHKTEDGIELLLEVGRRYSRAEAAAAAVKQFFSQFEGISPVELYSRYRPPFGTA